MLYTMQTARMIGDINKIMFRLKGNNNNYDIFSAMPFQLHLYHGSVQFNYNKKITRI